MQEPGLDRHEWESEWAALEPELADSPADALPELHDLVGRMLSARQIEEGSDPELVADHRAAGELVARINGGESVDPGDIAQAVDGLRGIYETLIVERSAP